MLIYYSLLVKYYYILIYLIFIVFFSYKIYNKRKFFILSPVDIFLAFYFLVVLITTLYHNYYPNSQKFDLYNLDSLNKKKYVEQVSVFLRMLTLFLFGVYIYCLLNKEYRIVSWKEIRIIQDGSLKINYESIYRFTVYIFIICLLLVFIDYGFDLFVRKKYIPKDSSIFKTIYTILLIALSVLSAILYRKYKIFSTVVIFTIVLIGIALGSRMATIDLAVFFVTYSVFIKKTKNIFLYYIVVIPFVILFFGYNLSLRLESDGHGLIPYLMMTSNKASVIFEYAQLNIYYTFVYGFYATSETIKLYIETNNKLMTCISPLPGSMTNWYAISENMRINKWAPYTAVGELAKFPVFSFFYYIFLGLYFSFIDFFVKKEILKKRYLFPILIVLMLCLMIMFSYEYNLRAAHRFIYYTAFLVFLSYLINKLKTVKIIWS